VVATLAAVTAVLVVGWGCLTLVDWTARTTSRASRTVPAAPVIRLSLNGGSHVTIVGEERTTIHIDRKIRRGIREVRATERRNGDTLVLDSNCPILLGNLCSVDYDLRVPAGTNVVGSTSGGNIDLVRVGRVDVRSGGGSIDIDRATGPIEARTGGGSIDARAIASSTFYARSGGGSVRVRFTVPLNRVDVASGGGGVHVFVPRSSPPYNVDASSGGGSTSVRIPTDPASTRVIKARSGGGSVSVEFLDAE
jgi:hypothetical protein